MAALGEIEFYDGAGYTAILNDSNQLIRAYEEDGNEEKEAHRWIEND